MARAYFEETQTFRENPWPWILVVISFLAAVIPITHGMYWQLLEGKPWGDKPMSDAGLIGIFIFIMFAWIIGMTMLLIVRLDLKIDSEGVHYKYIPIVPKWKLITSKEIDSYSIEKKFNFLQSGGFGYHRNLFTRSRSIRIKGGDHLSLILKNGQTLLLGTQNPEGLERAMKKLMNPKEMI